MLLLPSRLWSRGATRIVRVVVSHLAFYDHAWYNQNEMSARLDIRPRPCATGGAVSLEREG